MYSVSNLITIKCADGILVRDRSVLTKQSELASNYLEEYPEEKELDWTQISCDALVKVFCMIDDLIGGFFTETEAIIKLEEINWEQIGLTCKFMLLRRFYEERIRSRLRSTILNEKKRDALESNKLVLDDLVAIWKNPELIRDNEYRDCSKCSQKYVPKHAFDCFCTNKCSFGSIAIGKNSTDTASSNFASGFGYEPLIATGQGSIAMGRT